MPAISSIRRGLAGAACIAALLSGCSGSDEGAAEGTTAPAEAPAKADVPPKAEAPAAEVPEETTTTAVETTTPDTVPGDEVGAFGAGVDRALGGLPATAEDYSYVKVADASGALTVEVPAAWSDVDGQPGPFGANVLASTDVRKWLNGYDVAGIWVEASAASTGKTNDQILTSISGAQGQPKSCTSLGRKPYQDARFVGVSETFKDCGGTTAGFVWLAFSPPDGSFHGIVGLQLLEARDIGALEQAMRTFEFAPA